MSVRNFDSKPYLRVLKTQSDLSNLAKHIRNRGYNARVIKNKSSQSLYVRPRRYYAPIPETDVSRIATFPIALARVTNRQDPSFKIRAEAFGWEPNELLELDAKALIAQGPPGTLGLNVKPGAPDWNDLLNDIDRAYADNEVQISDQEKEITQFLQDLKETKAEIKNLERQSIEASSLLQKNDPATLAGVSNLTEDQWGIIQGMPEITRLFQSDRAELLTDRALIRGLMPYFVGEIPSDDPSDYSFKQLEDGRIGVVRNDVPTRIMVEFNSDWFDQYYSEGSKQIIGAWRMEFVNYLRQNGITEHELLANELMDDMEKVKDLQYWNWDQWDADLLKRKLARNDFKFELTDSQKEGIVALLEQLGIAQQITQGRAYSRKKFVEAQEFSNNNNARKKIAGYVWDRRMAGDNVVATDDIQAHLSKTMMKPPVMAQTTKFLSQDSRFKDMGYNRKVKLWSIDD